MKNLARSSEGCQEPRPASESDPPPAPICTRCGGPIGRYAFTVPTVDGDRHELCPQPPPIGERTNSPLKPDQSATLPTPDATSAALRGPEAITPVVERVRWLAARSPNALCDHPACHGSANRCDEYNAAARAKGGR